MALNAGEGGDGGGRECQKWNRDVVAILVGVEAQQEVAGDGIEAACDGH